MKKLLKSFDQERIVVAQFNNNEPEHSIKTLDLKLPASPVIKYEQGPASKAEETVYWLFRQRFFKKLVKLIPQISEFASNNNVSHILTVLDHPAAIYISKRLASSLNVPYSTFTSSFPETILEDLGYDAKSKKHILEIYRETQKGALSAGFSSLTMAEHYRAMCSANPIVLNAPFESIGNSNGNRNLHQSDTVYIGCILNPRNLTAIHTVVTACQEANWQVANQKISLRLIGSAVRLPFNFAGRPASIEILGGLSHEETVKALAECTVNFLPSWSERQFIQTAQLCYPDDFSVYAEAKRPILALSVIPSLIEDTMRAFSLGETIETCRENTFIQGLEKLVSNARNSNPDEGFRHLTHERFSEEMFSAALHTFLTGFPIEKKSNV